MKVLFMSHPDEHRQQPDFPPIGIAYLGGALHERGHEVLLIDSGLNSFRETVRQVKEFAPDFVGVTCWTINRATV